MKLRFLLLTVITLQLLHADVRFFPRVIYVDETDRSSTIYLQNPSEEAKKYKLYFGYTDQDEAGTFVPKKPNELGKDDRYGCEWLNVFPKRIELKAQEKQAIRISVKVPNDVPEGEYYCRLYAKSQPKPKELDTNRPDVKTVINTVMIIGAPIHVRKGHPKLTLDTRAAVVSVTEKTLTLDLAMTNTSKTGFRGDLFFEVPSKEEKPLLRDETKVTLQGIKRVFQHTVDISKLPSGKHTLQLYLSDEDTTRKGFKLIDGEKLNIGEVVFEKP